MRDTTSYTEMSTLAKCEMMWTLRYRDKVEQPDRAHYFVKGSMLHELFHGWWIGGDAQQHAEHTVLGGVPDDFDRVAMQDDVQWLYDRYVQHYAELRQNIRVVETELKLVNHLDGTDINVLTYIDQLVWVRNVPKREDGLYVVERKSMAGWDRLTTVDVDQQVAIALWQLRKAGWPVKGAIYDAIRTYRWKPDRPTQTALIENELATNPEFAGEYVTKKERTEWAKNELETHPGVERPIEESFRWLWLNRTDAQLVPVVQDMKATARRRAVLGAGEVPIRNIGSTCDRCSFRNECHGDLIFPELTTFDAD